MGQNALGQSRCKIFKSTVSPEKNDEKVFIFLRVYTDSWKLNIDLKILRWA